MSRVRVLVLAVGTRVGQNVVATLEDRRDDVALIATTSVAAEPGPYEYDTVHLVPPTASPAFLPRLLALLDEERIDLVVPCRDDDVLMLAALRDRHPELAPRLMCGGMDAATVICDKVDSATFSTRHALPFVPSLWGDDAGARRAFVRAHGFPLVAKPRRGYASIGVNLLWNDAQAARALARPDRVIQQFLGARDTVANFLEALERDGAPLFHTFQGVKHSIQALIAPDGAVEHVICTRNVSDRRRSKLVQRDDSPGARAIGQRCARAFADAGWRGPLNIQCQTNADGALRIHEFNGRFTGATVERWLLGFDEVGAAIAAFTGRTIAAPRVTADAAPREVFESVVARGANPADVATLTRDRVWHRRR